MLRLKKARVSTKSSTQKQARGFFEGGKPPRMSKEKHERNEKMQNAERAGGFFNPLKRGDSKKQEKIKR